MSQTNHLRVLLVDDLSERAQQITPVLRQQGYQVIGHLQSPQDLAEHVSRLNPDLVIIDMDSPDRDTLESMAAMNRTSPRPILFCAEAGADSGIIEQAVQAGVSAYVADGLNPQQVKPVIDVAIAQFKAFQSLRQELEQARTQLDERKQIEKAKGMLMKHQGCSEDQAYRTLRKLAMDRHQKLADVASNVISTLQLIN